MPEYFFIINDNYATGEGRTISILITRAYPKYEDYAVRPSEENGWKGELKYPKELLAIREFSEKFGYWAAKGAESISYLKLLENYKEFIPEIVIRILNAEGNNVPGNFNYFQEFHINYA